MLKCYLADRQRAEENHEIQADKKQYTYTEKGKRRGRQQCGIWATRWADGFCLIFAVYIPSHQTKRSPAIEPWQVQRDIERGRERGRVLAVPLNQPKVFDEPNKERNS